MPTFDLKQIIIQSSLFKPESIKWIAKIISNNLDKTWKEIDKIIRTTGEPLSKEEKKALGIRSNANISKKYFDSLSDKGKEDSVNSAFIIICRIFHKKSIIRQLEQVKKILKSGLTVEVELIATPDDRTCKSALDLDGKRFNFDDAPELPLSNCDAEWCRCNFLYHIERQK